MINFLFKWNSISLHNRAFKTIWEILLYPIIEKNTWKLYCLNQLFLNIHVKLVMECLISPKKWEPWTLFVRFKILFKNFLHHCIQLKFGNSTKRLFGTYCVKHTMYCPLDRQIYCCGRTFGHIRTLSRKKPVTRWWLKAWYLASTRVRNSHPIIGNDTEWSLWHAGFF